MVSFSTTGLLLYVALFRLGTIHDCAIGWPVLPYGLDSPQPSHTEVSMQRIGLAVVLALGLPLAPHASEAQQPPRTPRIGYLSNGTPTTAVPQVEAAVKPSATFRDRLRGSRDAVAGTRARRARRQRCAGNQRA